MLKLPYDVKHDVVGCAAEAVARRRNLVGRKKCRPDPGLLSKKFAPAAFVHAGVRLPSTTGKRTPPGLFCISRYNLGFAVVLECDLVQFTQIEIFPCHIRAVVVKYHHQVLHTTGFIGELEQTRFGYRNF